MRKLLPACKNIGTTHLTSGCYRLHPVEWGLGEAVGCLACFALKHNHAPHAIRANKQLLSDFQKFIREQGFATQWARIRIPPNKQVGGFIAFADAFRDGTS